MVEFFACVPLATHECPARRPQSVWYASPVPPEPLPWQANKIHATSRAGQNDALGDDALAMVESASTQVRESKRARDAAGLRQSSVRPPLGHAAPHACLQVVVRQTAPAAFA